MTDKGSIDQQNVEQNVRDYLIEEVPGIENAMKYGLEEMEITFRDAEFEYAQLQNWRLEINESVLEIEGVTFISVSQSNNSIRVGIKDEQFEDRIYELANDYGIPEDAIKISVTGVISKDAGTESLQGDDILRDKYRPLVGGLEISVYKNEFGNCTFSFNAYKLDQRSWLTNSHCTRERWTVYSDDDYYQSSDLDGSDAYIGSEFQDPEGESCGWWTSRKCRYADAALLTLSQDQSSDFGKIARTEYGAAPGEGSGSIVIDDAEPRFEIVEERNDSDFFEGLIVSKVGRTSGWTYGGITETCADVNHSDDDIGDFRYECQELAQYYSSGGDSGSPVFTELNAPHTDVSLNGIHWGRFTEGDDERIFSRISGVQQDLGNLTFVSGEEPSLSVNISGPGFIDESDTYIWEAETEHEQGSVSYQWSIKWEDDPAWQDLGTNQAQSVNVNDEEDFILQVEVEDDNNSDNAYRDVVVQFECEPDEPCQD